jgi:polysaccharide biosynthesis/export protein
MNERCGIRTRLASGRFATTMHGWETGADAWWPRTRRGYSFAVFLSMLLVLVAMALYSAGAGAQEKDLPLGAGDLIRITVFQNPELTTEARITESGTVTFPLLGEVQVGGLSTVAASGRIAQRLKNGGFVLQPQVSVNVVQFRSVQVSVLGHVARPGRFPIEDKNYKVSDLLAMAGGITPDGADIISLATSRSGKEERIQIDIPAVMKGGDAARDLQVANGDVLYVPRAPMFYIYGEVQRPGQYRVERGMTVLQALAVGGGLTQRGTQRGVTLKRRGSGGGVIETRPGLEQRLQAEDVVYVRESLF